MREVREREPHVRLAHLVVRDDRGGAVPARAAILHGDGDAEQAELSALFEQAAVELAGAIVFVGLRLDDLTGESAHRFAQQTVFVRRVYPALVEGHRRLYHSRSV